MDWRGLAISFAIAFGTAVPLLIVFGMYLLVR